MCTIKCSRHWWFLCEFFSSLRNARTVFSLMIICAHCSVFSLMIVRALFGVLIDDYARTVLCFFGDHMHVLFCILVGHYLCALFTVHIDYLRALYCAFSVYPSCTVLFPYWWLSTRTVLCSFNNYLHEHAYNVGTDVSLSVFHVGDNTTTKLIGQSRWYGYQELAQIRLYS